jgi:hypothetical protein
MWEVHVVRVYVNCIQKSETMVLFIFCTNFRMCSSISKKITIMILIEIALKMIIKYWSVWEELIFKILSSNHLFIILVVLLWIWNFHIDDCVLSANKQYFISSFPTGSIYAHVYFIHSLSVNVVFRNSSYKVE